MLFGRVWTHLSRLTSVWPAWIGEGQSVLSASTFPDFAFSDQWQILGPFQTGTRETPWSSDPLEYYGGFQRLEYDPEARFRSSLAFNGSVVWLNHTANVSDPDSSYSKITLHVDFLPTIDWPFLQDVFGWAGHQWFAWARGKIFIQSEKPKTLILDVSNVIEFWIDDTRYFGGDFYSYGLAPLTLYLDPGVHTIDVRIVGDVRAIGGVGSPTVGVKLELRESWPQLNLLYHGDDDLLISDVIGGDFGPLVSQYASIVVRNDAKRTAYVHSLEGMGDVCEMKLLSKDPIKIVPGQTRPIGFRIQCIPSYQRRLRLHFKHKFEGELQERSLFISGWPRVLPDMYAPHKITYLHPSGTVSWATLRPPSLDAPCGQSPNVSYPVMLALHGAAVNANDYPLVHMFDPLPDLCAWLLLPQGTTPWSGDDWHSWGLADVEAAIASIPKWIEAVEWQGPGVDVENWLMAGHSNGGQGVYYALTHRPDKIFAAAALSGYSSIQNYVPYSSWRTAEPGKSAIMEASLSAYRHDLLMDNAKGIPVIIQHGSKDDNVPAYHSRLMDLRILEAGGESAYHEIPDEPHFWDGVGTTKPLKQFFWKHLGGAPKKKEWDPVKLQSFSIVCADPGNMGPKNGVKVLQLQSPGQLGRLEFTFDPLTGDCVFYTSNIEEFHLPRAFEVCESFVVDEQDITVSSISLHGARVFQRDREWAAWDESSGLRPGAPSRTGRQLGQLDSILRTRAAFQIVRHAKQTDHIALQVSRNLAQYFAADTIVTDDYKEALKSDGNIISIAIADHLPEGMSSNHPIRIKGNTLLVRENGRDHVYRSRQSRVLAAIYLRPLPNERLELVVWGLDLRSLGVAARLVPMMTGSGQPDWIILDETMMWKGLDGALALGFFDSHWEVSKHAYFT